MFSLASDLLKFEMHTKDDVKGKVSDIYFDDQDWRIRYYVDETGKWLHEKRVLITPANINQICWDKHLIEVDMTQEEVSKCPSVEQHKPVSIRKEEAVSHSISWSESSLVWGMNVGQMPPVVLESPPEEEVSPQDVHLRSIQKVRHYHLHALDGEIGKVEDFMIDENTGHIRYLLVSLRHGLAKRQVILSPLWIKSIQWEHSEIVIDHDKDSIENSPHFDPNDPYLRKYEEKLHEHYQRPYYWSV